MTNIFINKDTMKSLKRGTKGMGTLSPDLTYIDRGYYPLIDNKPTIDSLTEKLEFELVINEINKVCNKVYTIIPIDAVKIFATKRRIVEKAINKLITKEVDDYNVLNGLAFDGIHNCASYKDMMDYAHQPFCESVWNWQTNVWEVVRQLLADINNGTIMEPTLEELLAQLPAR